MKAKVSEVVIPKEIIKKMKLAENDELIFDMPSEDTINIKVKRAHDPALELIERLEALESKEEIKLTSKEMKESIYKTVLEKV